MAARGEFATRSLSSRSPWWLFCWSARRSSSGALRKLTKIDPGFDPENALTPRWFTVRGPGRSPLRQGRRITRRRCSKLSIAFGRFPCAERRRHRRGRARGGNMSVTQIAIPGRALERADQGISIRRITPGYHEAMGMTLKAGRLFADTDRQGNVPVVIINESAAVRYFPGESAIGRSITVSGPRTIVGVVNDIHQSTLQTAPCTGSVRAPGEGMHHL